jgi:hypothetical protein
MKQTYPSKETRICNLLADFIVTKIGKEFKSKVQITDCVNFYVINGKTNSETILDMAEITDEFNEKFKEFLDDVKVIRTIDIIEYNENLTSPTKLNYTFYNTENNIYPDKDYENNVLDGFISKSNFPHGYSSSMGRNVFYNLKNIAYNVTKLGYIKCVEIKYDSEKYDDDIISVNCPHTKYLNETIKSAILDVFNLKSPLEYDFLENDIFEETLNYKEDTSLVRKTNRDFIIL